jgi:hypothetical protein
MTRDLIQGVLSAEQQQAALQTLAQLQSQLPFLIDLSVDERRSLPKMGDKSRTFVDQGLALATQNPGILPRDFDLDEYRRDATLVRQLEPLVLAMREFMSRLEDTYLAAGSDAYSQSLLIYQVAKLAGKHGALDQHLDSLGRRFARKAPGPANGTVAAS